MLKRKVNGYKDLSKFIPELVEAGIVRTMFIVTKLVKHGIENLIKGIEIPIPVWPSKP